MVMKLTLHFTVQIKVRHAVGICDICHSIIFRLILDVVIWCLQKQQINSLLFTKGDDFFHIFYRKLRKLCLFCHLRDLLVKCPSIREPIQRRGIPFIWIVFIRCNIFQRWFIQCCPCIMIFCQFKNVRPAFSCRNNIKNCLKLYRSHPQIIQIDMQHAFMGVLRCITVGNFQYNGLRLLVFQSLLHIVVRQIHGLLIGTKIVGRDPIFFPEHRRNDRGKHLTGPNKYKIQTVLFLCIKSFYFSRCIIIKGHTLVFQYDRKSIKQTYGTH